MNRLPDQEEQLIDTTVQRIWESIIYSMDQYTDDSTVSKFYLPEDLLVHCNSAAIIFTQLLYTPIPSPQDAKKMRLFDMIQLAMNYGVQIYLQERSLTKGYVPYRIIKETDGIRRARTKIGRILSEGIKVKPPVSQVMELFINHLNTPHFIRRFITKHHEFNKEKFENLLPAAIMWGYLLTQELLIDSE